MRVPLLLTFGALLLAGCSSEPGASVDPDAPAASAPEEVSALDATAAAAPVMPLPPPGAYEFTTTIRADGYQHARLEAPLEGTIRWWNVDDAVHAVYSDDGAFGSSGPIAPGSEFAYTFLRTGEYAYHCPYHADMRGLVVVS